MWWLKRQIHISWLIAIWCLGLLGGVLLAAASTLRPALLGLVLLVSIILSVVTLSKRYLFLIPLLVLAGLLFGWWRGSLLGNQLIGYQSFYGQPVSVKALVSEDADIKSDSQMALSLKIKSINDVVLPGKIYITLKRDDIKRGDEIWLNGKLQAGFGSFSGTIYRAEVTKLIQPSPGDIARRLRDWFADKIRQVLPEPEASLGIGFLVGQRRLLNNDLVLALQITGLTHVVVASGYNLTILVRLGRRLFSRWSKYWAILSSFGLIFGFMAITGLSPSMVRAGVVATLSLLAWYYGRKFHPLIILVLAMAITVLINPSYLWGDLGWQLSFAAFAGVMIFAPLINNYFFGDKKPRTFRQIIIETFSAQLLTAPIIIMSFGQFSNVALIANMLILAFVPLTMLLVFIAGLGSWLIGSMAFLADLIAWPARALLSYMVYVIDYLASFSWSSSQIKSNVLILIVSYGLIIIAGLYLYYVTRFDLKDSNLID